MTNLTDDEEKYEALRRRHVPSSRNGAVDWCVTDGVDWPCLTAQALDYLAMMQIVLTEVSDPHCQWEDDEKPETYPGAKARNDFVRLLRKARPALSTT